MVRLKQHLKFLLSFIMEMQDTFVWNYFQGNENGQSL